MGLVNRLGFDLGRFPLWAVVPLFIVWSDLAAFTMTLCGHFPPLFPRRVSCRARTAIPCPPARAWVYSIRVGPSSLL